VAGDEVTATYIVGDVFDVLATIDDGSVDMVMTSPPFLALRSYLPADHPDKAKEIGSEPTPAEFLDTLLALTAEWGRVLAPHGSICVELGDTYSGAGGENHLWDDGYSGGRKGNNTKKPAGSGRTRNTSSGWPLQKSLCGIPHLYHLSLAYGRNLLTGEPSPAGQWRVRNVVAWCRPNPPVGALGDKFRPATSYLTIATKAKNRWFDLDAVRHHNPRCDETHTSAGREQARADVGLSSQDSVGQPAPQNPAGAPPLDYWVIPTSPYRGSHYAVYPPALCEKPIKSMCPREVCRTCGEPRRRIVDVQGLHGKDILAIGADNERGTGLAGKRPPMPDITRTTLGWTDCGHDNYRAGIVLDPFAGSGTTLAVATGHGRDAIGIDIDERNADLARERVGMFLTVQELNPTPTATAKETA
jgi:site-specific DNA-methyltransferase (adenine-specific)